MKKYETPVVTVTAIKSESIMTVSGNLTTKASSEAQSSFKEASLNF